MMRKRRVTLNLAAFQTREALHKFLRQEMGLGDFYGENLDALYDALTSVAEDLEITLEEDEEGSCCEAVYLANEAARSEEMERYCRRVRRVIEDAAAENRHIHL